jgi:hypothetical protein
MYHKFPIMHLKISSKIKTFHFLYLVSIQFNKKNWDNYLQLQLWRSKEKVVHWNIFIYYAFINLVITNAKNRQSEGNIKYLFCLKVFHLSNFFFCKFFFYRNSKTLILTIIIFPIVVEILFKPYLLLESHWTFSFI